MSDSRTLLADAARRLAAAGVDNPRLDARVLLEQACRLTPSAEPGDRTAGGGTAALFESFVARRALREPLAYITGHKEFWSLDLEVGPGVLVPRPETETIIEQAIALFPDRAAPLKVLDLGTGTGCLPIAFLKEFPNASGLGIDSSEKARGYALRNVARHGLTARCQVRDGNWAEALTGPYSGILANPPYIRTAELSGLQPEVVRYEPVAALDGGEDGLAAYRTLALQIAPILAPGGLALFEIGAGQGPEVSALMAQAGLDVVKIAPDLAGIPRVLVARAGR